ncbi:hypothetical protein BN874_1920002 [Candidatus Contendobacter odensis Run_B_J11]|uniref:Uncharacterized protein n=1 Tax=Candidatus Contendobacter odensis Run_B_J11 TaxID=1400861 RepID=A0A7U7J295_9GAMM|nr:hypothetical protein BN874_1920002 [Candidatus Contendobacter odensis Run_B_J11]
MRRVRPRVIVECDPAGDTFPGLASGIEGVQVDALVFQGTPETLDEHVVAPPAAPVHGDANATGLQCVREFEAGERTPLIAVEDFRNAGTGQSLFQSRQAKVGLQGVGQRPAQDLATVPVHDRHQVQKALAHRDVGDVRAPDLIGLGHGQITQEIRIDLVLRARIARAWLAVNGPQPHQRHQPPHPVTAYLAALPSQLSCHLTRTVERIVQKQLVDPVHQGQLFHARSTGPMVESGARYSQKLALLNNTDLATGTVYHFPSPVRANILLETLAKKSRSIVS